MVDELLAAEAGIDGHDQCQVADLEHVTQCEGRRARIDRRAGAAVELADRRQRAVQVRARFVVNGDAVGTRGGKGVQVPFGLDDHQVELQGQAGLAPQNAHCVDAECEVGDEDPVHDIDVQPLGAAFLEAADLIGETAEIRCQEARRDPDGIAARAPRRARHLVMMPDVGIVTHRTHITGVPGCIVSLDSRGSETL